MTLSKFFSYFAAAGYVMALVDVTYAWWTRQPPGWYVLPAVT